jgi:hypothetical protein
VQDDAGDDHDHDSAQQSPSRSPTPPPSPLPPSPAEALLEAVAAAFDSAPDASAVLGLHRRVITSVAEPAVADARAASEAAATLATSKAEFRDRLQRSTIAGVRAMLETHQAALSDDARKADERAAAAAEQLAALDEQLAVLVQQRIPASLLCEVEAAALDGLLAALEAACAELPRGTVYALRIYSDVAQPRVRAAVTQLVAAAAAAAREAEARLDDMVQAEAMLLEELAAVAPKAAAAQACFDFSAQSATLRSQASRAASDAREKATTLRAAADALAAACA